MKKIQIDERHYKLIDDILKPYNLEVFVFGSRATGKAKKFSDLDLVTTSNLDKKNCRKIINQFEESNLPFKVDFLLWSELEPTFQENIKTDLVSWSDHLELGS